MIPPKCKTLRNIRIIAMLMAIFAGMALGAQLEAQGGRFPDPEHVDFDRPEAWALKYFASASLLTGHGVASAHQPGTLLLEGEIIQVPFLGEEYRRVGFEGVKVENLNNAPIILRPRLTYYFTERLSATASYVPPVEFWDVTPNVLAGSLNWLVYPGKTLHWGVRFYGQIGSAEGPFTCSEEVVAAGDDFEVNPFGCSKVSQDTAFMDYYGAELSVAYPLKKLGGLTPYFGIGVNHMRLKFKIDSTLFGEPDRRTQRNSGNTVNFQGGVTLNIRPRIRLGIQAFYTPLDVVRQGNTSPENDSLFNLRAQMSTTFGKISGPRWFRKSAPAK